MKLKSVNLNGYRNLSKHTFNFSDTLTVFVGLNGSGKTSVLEAVRYFSVPKSFRGVSDFDVVEWGGEHVRVSAEIIDASGISYEFVVFIEKNGAKTKKEVRVNGKSQKALDLLGFFPTVLFVPDDLLLITGSPSLRRTYLDAVLCQVSSKYCEALLQYKKAVSQRNSVLRMIQKREANESHLDVWDAVLVEHGARIIEMRIEFVDFLNGHLDEYYSEISGEKSELRVKYNLSVGDLERYEDVLVAKRGSEVHSGHTSVGPHRDDFSMTLQGVDLAVSGSRGEIRSTVISLKKAEIDYITDKTKKVPLFLLDDVMSELDIERQKRLLTLLGEGQVCITTTDLNSVDHVLGDSAVVHNLTA